MQIFFVWITVYHGRVHEKRPICKKHRRNLNSDWKTREQAKSRFKIVFWGVDRDKTGRIGFFGSSGGTSGFGLQIGSVPTRSGRLASMPYERGWESTVVCHLFLVRVSERSAVCSQALCVVSGEASADFKRLSRSHFSLDSHKQAILVSLITTPLQRCIFF